MRVVIKPIIKPQDNPTLNYREFEDVESIMSTISNNYVLVHRNGNTKVEFHLPDDCYLITTLDDEDKVPNVDMV